MKRRLFIGFGLAFVTLFAMFSTVNLSVEASNSKVRAYAGKLDDGKTIEVVYAPSAKKLGIVVKDKDGKAISGYILKGISDPKGEFDLSKAYRKFGEDSSIGESVVINKFKGKSATIKALDSQIKLDEVAFSGPPFGACYFVCAGPKAGSWYECFACCVLLDAC